MKDDIKREVESLAKRHPKRGIDPTIPEGVRMQLMDMRRQEEQDRGMKAHEGRKLAKGGSLKEANVKKSKKFAAGGETDVHMPGFVQNLAPKSGPSAMQLAMMNSAPSGAGLDSALATAAAMRPRAVNPSRMPGQPPRQALPGRPDGRSAPCRGPAS